MADTSFPASCKVFVQGNRADSRVPMWEVTLADPNPPVKRYDTSGPYTDPDYQVDLKKGLPALRRNWTLSRGDAEELPESSSAYRRQRESDPQLTALRFTELRNPWRPVWRWQRGCAKRRQNSSSTVRRFTSKPDVVSLR
ncbi:MAG: hypothetical protein O7G88_21095 [bacterium]|nr:hypothetical protein [bacterium]